MRKEDMRTIRTKKLLNSYAAFTISKAPLDPPTNNITGSFK